MSRLACVALLVLASSAWGQAPTPQAVKAKAGKQAVITSKATGDVTWVWDRRYLPEDQTYHDTAKKTLVITSGHAATFLVTAVEHQPTKGFIQTEYLVTFTGGPPGPDPPGPDPDALLAAIQTAYTNDPNPKKSEAKVTYAELLRQAASDDVRDPRLKIADDLQRRLHASAQRVIGDALAPVRKILWAEILKVLPAETTPLDGRRDQVAAVFLMLSETLGKVK